MELWIFATIAAAAVQTLRFSLQKRLKTAGLSTGGATFSRFVFAAPIAIIGAWALLATAGQGMPALGPRFWAYACAGGLAQIIATFCTVALFSERSFATGIAFTKTETVQVALFSALVLAEPVTPAGFAAILLGFVGVLLLSHQWGQGRMAFANRATALGLLAGGFFAASSIGYRGATLEIAGDDAFLRALLALACVTSFQTLAMIGWLSWREPGQIGRVLGAWRAAALVGVTGLAGSFGWFVAFSLMNAAYVRSLGQIELLFSLTVSILVFGERPRRAELAGMALLVLSILMIVQLA